MKWETITNENRYIPKALVSFYPKSRQVYFSKKILHDYFQGKSWVILRVTKDTKMLAIQPQSGENGDMTYKIVVNKKDSTARGGQVTCAKLFRYDFIPKIKTEQIPHWDPQMEWLTINFNGNGKNDAK